MRELTHILIVCRANQCRSPIAEFLLRRRVEALGIPVTVSSAGTHAEPGLPVHSLALRALQQRGIEPSGWTSRRLESGNIASADLILVADRSQLAHIAEMQPSAVRRGLPILQFASLAPLLAPLPVF